MSNKLFITAAIALLASGCSTDNRQRIAMETLYPERSPALVIAGTVWNDPMDSPAPVLAAALNEKFPPGTDLEELKNYIASFDGECDQRQAQQMMECRFVETGTICAVTEVIITAKTTPLNKIGHITAHRVHKVC